uniref:uncharacterized protein n=1 Tax=Myxine glutinosa TaxID=7769 RepID=UPI00358EC36B
MPPKKKSNAEAMKRIRARIKADPIAHEAYKQRERERYQRRKDAKTYPTIRDKSPRVQRAMRKKWKLEKRAQRKKGNDSAEQELNDIMPPPSPLPEARDESLPLFEPRSSHQKRAGRKKVKRKNRQAYRTIAKNKATIDRLEKQVRSLEKKLTWAQKKEEIVPKEPMDTHMFAESSPATKANTLLESGNVRNVRKQLTYGFALSAEVREKLKASKKRHKPKQVVHRITYGKIMKKYRLIEKAKKEMNLSGKSIRKLNETAFGSFLDFKRKTKENKEVAECVKSFYLQDINSAPASGKRETITRNKDKKQKRYLCDSLLTLHDKFQAEHDVRVSYTTFTRLRPFYVVAPSIHERDTVKCRIHSNCELKSNKLQSMGLLVHKDPYQLIKGIVCSVHNKACMYLECNQCKGKWGDMYTGKEKSSTEKTSYFEWENENEERQSAKGETIIVKVVNKNEKNNTISNLCQLFENDLKIFMPHQFRINHQFRAIKNLKANLSENECVLQIDFSENYACKATTEVQPMHFGGSRKQITLHTCHATMKDSIQCYCTLSEDPRHSAISIWAHLDPVLNDLSQKGIKVVHFVSDGPTTQYRNKSNFYLFSTLPFQKYNFKYITHNFLEAGHGKGPADGIGAAIKCTADRIVTHGQDVLNIK